MSDASPLAADEGVLRRRGRVRAVLPDGVEIDWVESQCRGCVGCGGRCSLFAPGSGSPGALPLDSASLSAGMLVDVELPIAGLRHASSAAYGLALLALLSGCLLGHALGSAAGHPDAGALLGLLLGTFAAGRLTKRLATAPRLAARPCAHQETQAGNRP